MVRYCRDALRGSRASGPRIAGRLERLRISKGNRDVARWSGNRRAPPYVLPDFSLSTRHVGMPPSVAATLPASADGRSLGGARLAFYQPPPYPYGRPICKRPGVDMYTPLREHAREAVAVLVRRAMALNCRIGGAPLYAINDTRPLGALSSD